MDIPPDLNHRVAALERTNAIRPTLEIIRQRNRGGIINVSIEFDSFDKAMEFNVLIVDWLVRELSDESSTCIKHAGES